MKKRNAMVSSIMFLAQVVQYSCEISFKNLFPVGHCIYFAIHSSHHIPTFTCQSDPCLLASAVFIPHLNLPTCTLLSIICCTSLSSGNSLANFMPIHVTLKFSKLIFGQVHDFSQTREHTHKNKRMCSH